MLEHVFLRNLKDYWLIKGHCRVIKWCAFFQENDLRADPCFSAANPKLVSLGLIRIKLLVYWKQFSLLWDRVNGLLFFESVLFLIIDLLFSHRQFWVFNQANLAFHDEESVIVDLSFRNKVYTFVIVYLFEGSNQVVSLDSRDFVKTWNSWSKEVLYQHIVPDFLVLLREDFQLGIRHLKQKGGLTFVAIDFIWELIKTVLQVVALQIRAEPCRHNFGNDWAKLEINGLLVMLDAYWLDSFLWVLRRIGMVTSLRFWRQQIFRSVPHSCCSRYRSC